ncbi:MAG: hypothetical protein KBS41_05585, partial [Oscillospiraceae bacterium]|nr:hypothetical protein [Candidatus Equicaccousia limihippi]
ILGFTQGFLPFCAYYFGKSDIQKLRSGLSCALKICIGISLLFTAAFLIFPKWVIGIFIDRQGIYNYAKTSLMFRGDALVFAAVVQVFTVYYQATAEKIKAAVLSLLRQAVLLLPLCFLVRYLPLDKYINICLAMPIADVITFIICLLIRDKKPPPYKT